MLQCDNVAAEAFIVNIGLVFAFGVVQAITRRKCKWWKETGSEVNAGARLSFGSVRTLEHCQADTSLRGGVAAVSQNNTVLVLSYIVPVPLAHT